MSHEPRSGKLSSDLAASTMLFLSLAAAGGLTPARYRVWSTSISDALSERMTV